MTRNNCLISVVLLVSIIGVLALTASDYVGCTNPYPDEFLDFAFECPYPILPVFAPQLNTHPLLLHSLKIFYFQKIDFLSPILRC